MTYFAIAAAYVYLHGLIYYVWVSKYAVSNNVIVYLYMILSALLFFQIVKRLNIASTKGGNIMTTLLTLYGLYKLDNGFHIVNTVVIWIISFFIAIFLLPSLLDSDSSSNNTNDSRKRYDSYYDDYEEQLMREKAVARRNEDDRRRYEKAAAVYASRGAINAAREMQDKANRLR